MYMDCLDPDCGWGRVSLPPHVRGMMSSTTLTVLVAPLRANHFISMLLTATFMRCWTLLRISCHLHSGVDIFHDSLHDYATQLSLISLVRLLLFAMINFPTLIFFFSKSFVGLGLRLGDETLGSSNNQHSRYCRLLRHYAMRSYSWRVCGQPVYQLSGQQPTTSSISAACGQSSKRHDHCRRLIH